MTKYLKVVIDCPKHCPYRSYRLCGCSGNQNKYMVTYTCSKLTSIPCEYEDKFPENCPLKDD